MLFPSQAEAAVQLDMAPEEPSVHVATPHGPERPKPRDIAFIPLALPGTAGPGTIALIISSASALQSHGGLRPIHHLAVISVAILLALLFWICLRSPERGVTVLGESGIAAVSKRQSGA